MISATIYFKITRIPVTVGGNSKVYFKNTNILKSKNSCSWTKLLNSHQKLYEFWHFSICCSQYHSLFKKPKLSWNGYVLVENERSVWDPAGISSCGPCPCLLLKKPVVVFTEPYLSNLMTKFINYFFKRNLMILKINKPNSSSIDWILTELFEK